MLIFGIFKNSKYCMLIQVLYTSKFKVVLSECNDLYFIAIVFIDFTLHEIKQNI
jgi:hypothetical protein